MSNKGPLKQTPADAGGSARREVLESQKVQKPQSDPGAVYDSILRFLDAHDTAVDAEPPQGIDAREWERLLECSTPIRDALERYCHHEVKTLDEAFRIRRPENYRRPAAFERSTKSGSVYRDCMRLYHAGVSVDPALFEAVASLHGMPASRARDYFYYRKELQGRAKLPPRRWHRLPERLAALDIAKDCALKEKFRTSPEKPGYTQEK